MQSSVFLEAETRMEPIGIVPALDELENRETGQTDTSITTFLVNVSRSISLRSRIAKNDSHIALSWQSPLAPIVGTFLQPCNAPPRRLLCADILTNAFVLVRVMNRFLRTPLRGRHVQCFADRFIPQVAGHLPADNLPASGIGHECQVQIALLGRHVGDICHPELIGPRSSKVSIHEVGVPKPDRKQSGTFFSTLRCSIIETASIRHSGTRLSTPPMAARRRS